jgi:hypothetical protein
LHSGDEIDEINTPGKDNDNRDYIDSIIDGDSVRSDIDKDKDKDTGSYKDKDNDKDSYDDHDRGHDSDRERDKDSYDDHDRGHDSDRERDKDSYDYRDKGKENESVRSNESDNLSERLKELLNDTDNESVRSTDTIDKNSGRGDKYSRHRESKFDHRSAHRSVSYRSVHNDRQVPPTLAELEQRGTYRGETHLRDINQVNMGEQENEDRKRELLFKFDLLKKSYPNSSIPEFSIHSDLTTMQKSYDDSVRRLSLDSTVENYKTYLIGGFMLVEFIFGNFLGFDMQGFTQQQIVSMNSYEKLLIELGEKSYVPKGSKWPVELRLLFLIIMNAAFFIVSKMIMKKTGANLMNMINGMNTSSVRPSARKRKMRGPNINLDDIPEN